VHLLSVAECVTAAVEDAEAFREVEEGLVAEVSQGHRVEELVDVESVLQEILFWGRKIRRGLFLNAV
jgi:hypothetical protein